MHEMIVWKTLTTFKWYWLNILHILSLSQLTVDHTFLPDTISKQLGWRSAVTLNHGGDRLTIAVNLSLFWAEIKVHYGQLNVAVKYIGD